MNRHLCLRTVALLTALLLLLCALPMTALAKDAPVSSKKHTIMFYMPGSGLQERYGIMTNKVNEIINSGVDLSRVNVCLCLGGADHWEDFNTADGAVRMFKLTNTGLEEIEKAKSRDMSAYSTLKTFIDACVKSAPASNYSLVLVGMGGSTIYGCVMDSHKFKVMNVSDVIKALKGSKLANKRLKWIGLDASLMASIEACAQLKPYAEYLLASEEVMPGYGLNYSFLGDSNCDLTGNTEKLLQDISNDYVLRYLGEEGVDLTLSVLKLDAADAVVKAIDSIFAAKKGPFKFPDDVWKISQAVSGCKSMGNWGTDITYNLYDLNGFADNLSEYAPTQANNLKSALSALVVNNVSTISGANGVSFYYPLKPMGMESACAKVFKSGFSVQGYSKNFTTFLSTYIKERGKSDVVKGYTASDLEVLEADSGNTYTLSVFPGMKDHFVYGEYVFLKKYTEPVKPGDDEDKKAPKAPKNVESTRTYYYLLQKGIIPALDESGNLTVTIPNKAAAIRTSDNSNWEEVTLQVREILPDGTYRAYIPLRVSPCMKPVKETSSHPFSGNLQVQYRSMDSAASFNTVPDNIKFLSPKYIRPQTAGDYIEGHEKVVISTVTTSTGKKNNGETTWVPFSQWTESAKYLRSSSSTRVGSKGIQVNFLDLTPGEYAVMLAWYDEFGHVYNSTISSFVVR